MLVTELAVFHKLDFIRRFPLVLGRCIIPSLAKCTCKSNIDPVHC